MQSQYSIRKCSVAVAPSPTLLQPVAEDAKELPWWRAGSRGGHAGRVTTATGGDMEVHQSWHSELLRKDYTNRRNLPCLR